MPKSNSLQPILKWAGGKRQLMGDIISTMPPKYKRYFEPFVGGAAVLLYLQPKKATINDLNTELIELYCAVKQDPEEVMRILRIHKQRHSQEYYYSIRNQDRNIDYHKKNIYEKAARTIYLNHTCYNGLYRVNKSGFFNTPFGKYESPSIFDSSNIINISEYFNNSDIKFLNTDYKKALAGVKKEDFVYLDPPYDPISNTSNYTAYTSRGFGKEDQKELKETCDNLTDLGVYFMQSNSNTDYIRKLYRGYNMKVVRANRSINNKGNNRTGMEELLIYNYDID